MKFLVNESAAILDILIKQLKLSSKTRARNLIKEKSVFVDDELVERPDEIVANGQTVQIKRGEKAKFSRKAPFKIFFEDEFIIVVLKPAGVLSVNRENENSLTFHKSVNNHVREVSRNRERVFLVHRLDREVSGIMIFAKSLAVQALLEDRWKENEKCYLAVTEGIPEKSEGTVESWLRENTALKVFSTKNSDDAKYAVTHYKVIQVYQRNALIEVHLETGRKHQIRVHLSDMGCPIIGDKKYGARSDMGPRIALHAYRLAFFHPISGERLSFEASLPKEMLPFIGRS